MRRKYKRLSFIGFGLVLLVIATALVLSAFEDNIVFFLSPTEIKHKIKNNKLKPEQRMRVGGLVKTGTVTKGATNRFEVTDLKNSIIVEYKGILPDLFREGQGIIAEGHYKNPIFIASEVLAKHDENYMPPEVAEALKRSGKWKPLRKE